MGMAEHQEGVQELAQGMEDDLQHEGQQHGSFGGGSSLGVMAPPPRFPDPMQKGKSGEGKSFDKGGGDQHQKGFEKHVSFDKDHTKGSSFDKGDHGGKGDGGKSSYGSGGDGGGQW